MTNVQMGYLIWSPTPATGVSFVVTQRATMLTSDLAKALARLSYSWSHLYIVALPLSLDVIATMHSSVWLIDNTGFYFVHNARKTYDWRAMKSPA